MRSWAREFALGLLLSTALASVAAIAAPSAEQVLLDKANYWRLKDRPDLALGALEQLLSLHPDQPDALYQYGVLKVQQGKLDEAKNTLAKLRNVAPSSPHIAELENTIRAGQVSPNELSEARRLAQSGQFAQAAQKYQQTFKGAPPPTFGVEYYSTLAGTPQGWEEARRGLETLVQNSPNDSRAKLALAQVLTYHADTRPEGIRMLQQLSNDAAVGSQAVTSWKQALLWLGGGPQDRQLYAQYLAKFPDDAELRQHAAEAGKGGAPGAPGPASANAIGYANLNRGNLAAAEREFAADLRQHTGNADSIAGLGLIRLRQQRFIEARDLLGRAMRAAPSQRGKWASAYASAELWAEINEGKAANSAGNYARAEAIFRRVLSSHADNSAALAGLYTALNGQGKSAEAATLSGRVAALGGGHPGGANRARADALRSEGRTLESRGDAVGAQAKFQEAIAVDPDDAWARLDYARFLLRQGNAAQAAQMIDPAASGGAAESLYAAAIFYSEQNQNASALALLDRIPAGSRNADMNALHERLLAGSEIDRAKQLARSGNTAAARNVLMSLYSRPPQTPQKTRLVADALADIGDTQEALQLARPTNPGDKAAAIDYASLLYKSGRDAEATAYLAHAENSGRVGPGDRQNLEHVKIDIAVRRADALRTRGDIAGAYDQISPLLNAYPNDPQLLLAAGRIYAANGDNEIAMRFFDAAYRQAPTDLGVIRGAVGGAIVAGDLERARAYLAAGMQVHPNNPRLYFLAAEIARANGDNGAAIHDLQAARNLDMRQAGSYEPLPPSATAPGAGSPTGLPPNPFRRSDAGPPDRYSKIAQAANSTATTTEGCGGSLPPPEPLQRTATSADSDDLVLPPYMSERPARTSARLAAFGPAENASAPQSAALMPDAGAGSDIPDAPAPVMPAMPPQLAQLEPLPPPPIGGYQTAAFAAAPVAPTSYAAPLQPLPPPPVPGYQPPLVGQSPVPRDSLELDIERSMAAINAESSPIIQGGFAFRARSGEQGLSRLTEVGVPIESTFSPFYTGTVRLQAIPVFLDAGTPSETALTRFGTEGLLALNPGTTLASLPRPGSQTAGGVSLNVGYAYQMFAGEVGTSPLGFPVENIIGRIALQWPGPATLTTAYPVIPPIPTGANPRPLQVKIEGIRQPVVDSLLSYAGTKDPVSGLTWGGVVKTGGDALVSWDDGFFGIYGGGGASSIEGKSVASNSEIEGIVGAYVRPYRTANTALKVGLNLNYMGYDRNLRYFTFGQGGYFSPQSYLNVSVPVEYTGRYGRLAWLAGAALGVQTFHEDSSPYFPTEPGNQAAAQAAFGNLAVYPGRNVTGPAFFFNGQLEYQLDNGFSVGGLASVDNAQNYTEGIAKVYLRRNFGALPSRVTLPHALSGTL